MMESVWQSKQNRSTNTQGAEVEGRPSQGVCDKVNSTDGLTDVDATVKAATAGSSQPLN